jgi:prolyl oligopeptidase
MPKVMTPPPRSDLEPVTEILHGVCVTDPYRWLEDQDSHRTRAWLEEQTRFARSYLDNIPGRDRIRARMREFLTVETFDSLQIADNRYFFRKRLPDQEQPCIYMREGPDGRDHLLIDPAERGTGKYTAVKPLRVSPDGRLLLYEVKEGGERTGTFELLEIETRRRVPDLLPRGYLRGFAFAPDGKSFYYVHEAVNTTRPFYRAAYQHLLGAPPSEDKEIFFAGEDQKIRLGLFSDSKRLVFRVLRFLETIRTDFYLALFEGKAAARPLFRGIDYMLALRLVKDKFLAITNHNAPNRRIVEIRPRDDGEAELIDVVQESDALIKNWLVVGDHIIVSYMKQMTHRVYVFDLSGQKVGEMPIATDETVRFIWGAPDNDELLLESESFVRPIHIFRYSAKANERTVWAQRKIPFDSAKCKHAQIWFTSKDGTRIPMYLVGRCDVIERGGNPTIMTSYGGFGTSMTPQFSALVACLLEHGCLFALPNIRGGSEFGVEWHDAAKRRNRQTAYDDFLFAAEWLIKTGRTPHDKLAIFGGSNSGLLVGAALTQRPDLFCAVVCMVPLLDMLRYHLFDNAHVWKDEFGTADDPHDFMALAKYSPYHQVRQGVVYPATMVVSGDADCNCNPLHARKMVARLQAATASEHPIFLCHSKHRGHSPVLPLSERVDALTDRVAFLCDQLQISV